ncbi:MAG: hypothetical protein ACU0DI_00520 [Paracoccaceae bacterium]
MTFAMKQIVGGLLAMTLAVSGGMAMAKGHDQGIDEDATPNITGPGQNVQAETVGPAQGLGADFRASRGFSPQ